MKPAVRSSCEMVARSHPAIGCGAEPPPIADSLQPLAGVRTTTPSTSRPTSPHAGVIRIGGPPKRMKTTGRPHRFRGAGANQKIDQVETVGIIRSMARGGACMIVLPLAMTSVQCCRPRRRRLRRFCRDRGAGVGHFQALFVVNEINARLSNTMNCRNSPARPPRRLPISAAPIGGTIRRGRSVSRYPWRILRSLFFFDGEQWEAESASLAFHRHNLEHGSVASTICAQAKADARPANLRVEELSS